MTLKRIIVALATTLTVGSALAQTPANLLAVERARDRAKLVDCRGANETLDKWIDNTFDKAKATGHIDSKEEATYKGMENQIKRHPATLAGDKVTLKECESLSDLLKKQKIAVEKMADIAKKQAESFGDCFFGNRKLEDQIKGLFESATRAGRIDKDEAAEFKKIEARIAGRSSQSSSVAKKGGDIKQCESMRLEYENELAAVKKMAEVITKRAATPVPAPAKAASGSSSASVPPKK